VKVTPYGTRGSLAAPGPGTARYGGNTSCVRVDGEEGTVLVLDAGTGIRVLGRELPPGLRRVDVLLTHLHLDHILGLGFFGPLYDPAIQLHVWGPASVTQSLGARISRYLSPPLFPVALVDLPCEVELHHVRRGTLEIGEFRVETDFVCHPGPTVGYRIESRGVALAYLPDHEPALGVPHFPLAREWTSGFKLAEGAELLLHDAQYTRDEYASRVGWGHSSMHDALGFARLAGARCLAPFHHDPGRDDAALEATVASAVADLKPDFEVRLAAEGISFEL
jgi:ribonuclease BN (tRNA processing enzyme)